MAYSLPTTVVSDLEKSDFAVYCQEFQSRGRVLGENSSSGNYGDFQLA